MKTIAESPRWPVPTIPTLDELRELSEAATFGPWVGCAHVMETDKECPCRYRGDVWSATEDVALLQMGFGPDHPDGRDDGSGWRSVPTTSLGAGLRQRAPHRRRRELRPVRAWTPTGD